MKYKLVSLLIVLSLSLGACSAGGDTAKPVPATKIETTTTQATTTTTTTTMPVTTTTLQSVDDIYLETIRSNTTTLDELSDEDLLAFADAVCADLDSNPSIQYIINQIQTADEYLWDDLFFTAGAAIAGYCPEYTDLFN